LSKIAEKISSLAAEVKKVFRRYLRQRKVHHQIYEISGATNLDTNLCFSTRRTYPDFQKELDSYKATLKGEFATNSAFSSFKFGDGDYYFLNQIEIGSAKPGNRALSRRLNENEMQPFIQGSKKCDRYYCEIYPENRKLFREIFPTVTEVIPAEFNYGLIANKWMFREFGSSIGIIGASEKIKLIKSLMQSEEYQDYLGLKEFTDYISVPQKFACDNLEELQSSLSDQLQFAKSKVFLFGVGHVKSGIAWQLPRIHQAMYVDIGSGIDALAGVIDSKRPYFGDWTNYRIQDSFDYSQLDLLQLESSRIKYL